MLTDVICTDPEMSSAVCGPTGSFTLLLLPYCVATLPTDTLTWVTSMPGDECAS